MTDTISHFAGPRMDICGRIVQRCAVCGAKLCDSDGVMVPLNLDGTTPLFPTFPEGRVVQVAVGNPTRYLVMPDTDKLPADACVEFI